MKLGILGGGQLGRMLALAAQPLGVAVRVWENDARCPASVAAEMFAQPLSAAGVAAFASGLDACTYEFEHIPHAVVEGLAAAGVPLRPCEAAFAAKHDRAAEKRLLDRLGIPCAPWHAVDDVVQLEAAAAELGLPLVLKSRRGGYDGKGQAVVRDRAALAEGLARAGGRDCIAEAFVPFVREVSLIAVRGVAGTQAFYPLVRNEHRDGILRLTLAPDPQWDGVLQVEAEAHARVLMDALGYVGVLAIEFFVVGGRLVVNEFAPRVHNSGHWTIEGAETSQFANHVRAVCGLPLGSTAVRGHGAMLNYVGREADRASVLAVPGAHLHSYGKSERARRKLGHITVRCDHSGERDALVERLAALAPWA
jgi:5-(carboxyamino)imidazole ribonucleotide synthase